MTDKSYVNLDALRDLMRARTLSRLRDMGVSAVELSVLKVIVGHTNKDGYCYPSYETIADETFYSRRACIAAVGRLEALGWIERAGHTNRKGGRGSNLYLVHLWDAEQRCTAFTTNGELGAPLMVNTVHPNKEEEERILIPDSDPESPLTPLGGNPGGSASREYLNPNPINLAVKIAAEEEYDGTRGTEESGQGLRHQQAMGMG